MPKALIQDTEKILFILDQLLEETKDINKAPRSYLKRITKTLGLRRLSLTLLEEGKGELFVKEAFGLRHPRFSESQKRPPASRALLS